MQVFSVHSMAFHLVTITSKLPFFSKYRYFQFNSQKHRNYSILHEIQRLWNLLFLILKLRGNIFDSRILANSRLCDFMFSVRTLVHHICMGDTHMFYVREININHCGSRCPYPSVRFLFVGSTAVQFLRFFPHSFKFGMCIKFIVNPCTCIQFKSDGLTKCGECFISGTKIITKREWKRWKTNVNLKWNKSPRNTTNNYNNKNRKIKNQSPKCLQHFHDMWSEYSNYGICLHDWYVQMHLQIKLMCFPKLLLWIVNIVQFPSPMWFSFFYFLSLTHSLSPCVCVFGISSDKIWGKSGEKWEWEIEWKRVWFRVFGKTNKSKRWD